VLARVIENWLDSAGERGGYEIPFCQALVAQGQRILFRSSHGPLEQGKDIITVDPKGQYHAYQLKAGDLTLSTWREIRGEVEELVGLPLQHPDIPEGAPFRAHLVTSGILRDPARKTIKDWKQTWEQEGRRPLELLDKDRLIRLFLDTHGDVLLASPAELERFLRLFLADKRDILDKKAFAAFLESCLPLEADLKRSELRRALASGAVLASYVLQGYERAGNHHALVEGWMIVIAYLLATLERFPLYLDHCRSSLELCIAAWEKAAESLTQEALAAPRWIEGDFMSDYAVRAWRVTSLLGHMCSFALYRRVKGSAFAQEGEILQRVTNELAHMFFWGESAGPFCFSIALLLWLHGQEELACQWCGQLAKLISHLNGRREGGLGVPDPYIEAQEILKMRLGENPFGLTETFRSRSFLLPVLVEFLARRGRKRMLKSLWHDICEIDRSEFTLDRKTDLYRWRAKTGSLDSRRWPHPARWGELLAEAQAPVPQDRLLLTQHFLPLLMPFLTIFPHRFTCPFARLVESSV